MTPTAQIERDNGSALAEAATVMQSVLHGEMVGFRGCPGKDDIFCSGNAARHLAANDPPSQAIQSARANPMNGSGPMIHL
jgi:hypothetical protein